MEEFRLELEQLTSEGLKFNVKSQGTGNIYLSIPDCDVSVYQENGEICGEIIIEKTEENMKFTIDFDAVDFVYSVDDMKYCLQMDNNMFMSDINISVTDNRKISFPNGEVIIYADGSPDRVCSCPIKNY